MKISWSKEHYQLEDGKVHWWDYELKGADVASFAPLNHIWARDSKRIYTQNSANKLADRKTFQVLNHIFAKDKNRVFYLSGWIKEADVNTFRVLDEGRFCDDESSSGKVSEDAWDYSGFACDATQVFHDDMLEGKPVVLRGADPKTFRSLQFGFGKDSDAVFHGRWKLKKVNPQTFRVLNQSFSTDGKRAYYFDQEIASADAASFEVLGEYWARDAKRIYFQKDTVPQADRATFELIDYNFGRDRKYVYGYAGEILAGADAKSFQRIKSRRSSLFYRDKRRVYYQGKPVGGADPKSFEVGPGYNEGRDHAWLYVETAKTEPRAGAGRKKKDSSALPPH